jgi:hypothetical protein
VKKKVTRKTRVKNPGGVGAVKRRERSRVFII